MDYSFADVCVRGVRSYHLRAGGALPPPEGQPSVLAGAAQVLRQAALQVHQLAVRQQPARPAAHASPQLGCAIKIPRSPPP